MCRCWKKYPKFLFKYLSSYPLLLMVAIHNLILEYLGQKSVFFAWSLKTKNLDAIIEWGEDNLNLIFFWAHFSFKFLTKTVSLERITNPLKERTDHHTSLDFAINLQRANFVWCFVCVACENVRLSKFFYRGNWFTSVVLSKEKHWRSLGCSYWTIRPHFHVYRVVSVPSVNHTIKPITKLRMGDASVNTSTVLKGKWNELYI